MARTIRNENTLSWIDKADLKKMARRRRRQSERAQLSQIDPDDELGVSDIPGRNVEVSNLYPWIWA